MDKDKSRGGERVIKVKRKVKGSRCAPNKSGWIKEEDIEPWLQKMRGPGLRVTVEKAQNLLGQEVFRIFHYEREGLKGFVTFCLADDEEYYFNMRGGGRYGAQSEYNYEERD